MILRVLRILGRNNSEVSEVMNDILAQVLLQLHAHAIGMGSLENRAQTVSNLLPIVAFFVSI